LLHRRNEAGKTRFYVPFILSFLVFSAVLATEYLIVTDMLKSAYRYQSMQYNSIAGDIVDGLNIYYDNIQSDTADGHLVLQSLQGTIGIPAIKTQIVCNEEQLNAYIDSSFYGGGFPSGIDTDDRVIETSIAKTANGEILIVEAIEHNNKQIKYLKNISIALIIILLIMVIIAIVPGALMIESLTRRRRMTGSVLSSDGSTGWENIAEILSGSEVTGCMVVSSGNEVLWTNGTCRRMLEIDEKAKGFSLASVTSLPDKIRLRQPPYSPAEERETVRVKSMSGDTGNLFMEIFPVHRGGTLQYRLFTFTRPVADDSHFSGGRAAGIGDPLDTGSPAGVKLAESMIHDMNNQLSGIIGAASLELDRTPDRTASRESCSAILESAEKMTALCADLQSLLTGEDDPVLRDVVEEMNLISEVMRRILPEDVKFQVSGSSEKLVSVKREHLRDLIYNLSVNSTGMMSGEGRIRIDISERIPSGISQMESVPPGSRVCIRYSDGYIMPVALRDALSSRKYTVPDVEREFGTAIGALYRILREIDGSIVFERGSGETVLCIILEGIDSVSRTNIRGVQDQIGSASVTGLSVLVADEVDIVLLSTCEYLEHRGMVTTGVSNGDSALELLRTRKFDAAVIDLNMPGTSTPSIVRFCQTSLPSMAVIITTGYGMNASVRELIKAPSTDCIYKPHRPEALVETIYSTLMRIQEGDQT